MDLQFMGANCFVLGQKDTRVVVDDNLASLGGKSVTKADDIVLQTYAMDAPKVDARMVLNMPGEYEIGKVSITGIAARGHMDEEGKHSTTMYKVSVGDINYVFTGHIYPALTDDQLEALGIVDVLCVPVGGHGYTLDPVGALKIIRAIEPKIVVPAHYADKALKYEVPQLTLDEALKELAMEPKERLERLKLKPGELSDTTSLIVIEKA